MKSAIITGVAGQDGSFLADSLLAKGYEVHGVVRPSTRTDIHNLSGAEKSPLFHKHEVDLLETESLTRLIRKIQPDEFYNLGACSFVPVSWELPDYVSQVNGLAVLKMMEAIRNFSENTRFYQASSSEMFGKVRPEDLPIKEHTYHHPRSPYGVSKSFAHNLVRNYRESYGLHFSNGILFNHESERRDPRFVTRKITTTLVKTVLGGPPLRIGNLEAKRDWGYAPDYVEAMQLMLQDYRGGDWVVATGETRTVRQFIEETLAVFDRSLMWVGEGSNEEGQDENTGEVLVTVDPEFYRPAEVDVLLGDATLIREELGWKPKTTFAGMVRKMVDHDARNAVRSVTA